MARSLGTKYRFTIAYLVLGVLVGAALGAFIVLVQRPGHQPAAQWSPWRPPKASTGQTAQAIAAHIGSSYRVSSSERLARAVADVPASLSSGFSGIALASRQTGGVTLEDPGRAVMYTLCGTKPNCRVAGQASIAQGDVLRREVLELALYTFKYVDAEDVGVFFPPATGDRASSNVFFFNRSDLKPQLSRPLRQTLPRATPPLPGKLSDRELQAIDDLTGGHRFRFAVKTGQSGARYLVLQPAA